MSKNPDIEKMREQISNVYGPEATKWRIRCKNMPPRQVAAIYLHMKEKGKFDRRRKEVRITKEKNERYHQMTLWDYGIDL